MKQKFKNIVKLFVLLIGVLGNVFAIGLVYDGSKKSIEKRAVDAESIKAWEAMIPDELLRKDVSWLTKVSDHFTLKPNRLDEFKSHFIIDKGKGRVQAYLKSLTGRQTHIRPVFRNQQSSLGYEDFFNNGITPKGTHDNLLMHTESNTIAGNFISTTLDKDIATQFGSQNGCVFEIRSTNGIDINKTLGADAMHPGQLEGSIPDVILSKEIKGVWQKARRSLNYLDT
jgi:hypothetical protein